jgi:hypothetical protein
MRRQVIAAGAAGLVAAVVVPLDRPGIGWLLAGLVALGAVLVAGPRRPWAASRVAAAVMVVPLLGVSTVRASVWLFELSLATALAFASLAVATGGPMWRRLTGIPAAVFAVPRLWWVAVPSVAAVLLLRADPAPPRWLAGPAAGGLFFTLVLAAVRVRSAPEPSVSVAPQRWERRRWLVPVVALELLVGGYVLRLTPPYLRNFKSGWGVVEMHGVMDRDVGLFGFWPTLAVGVLCLGTVVVLGFRVVPRDRMLLRAVGGGLCLLAVAAAVGAAMCLEPYVERYGFTTPRTLALVGLVLLAVVALVVAVAGRLPRGIVWLAPVTVLALAAINPEARAAGWMTEGWYWGYENLDTGYLSGLSADAVPELEEMRRTMDNRDCILAGWAQRQSTVDSWYAFNLSRRTARAVLAAHPVPSDARPCRVVEPPRHQRME